VIVFKGMQLTPEWITRCRALTGKALWANLNPDDPLNVTSRGSTNGNVVASIRLYDLYATWSRRLIKALKRAGCLHVLYLPFGYDPRLHYPTDQLRGDLKDTITFVGAWDKEREQVLSYLADMPLKVFGFGWDRVGPRSPLQGKVSAHNIYEEELRQVVTSSMASINILRPQNEGSHNMRTFEIPAMRGLMITDYSEEQEEFFPGGRASIMYRDPEELRCQLEKVRMRAYETTEIRSEGYALSQEHSYLRRAGTLLDELGRIEELRSRSPG
jgi:spore maturation protein CgeB